MKPTSKKTTLRALADHLGISTATVSRALRNNRVIHADTRARVMTAAAQLGYTPSTRVSPAKGENLRALLLFPPNGRRAANNLVFPFYLRGITTAANVIGCTLRVEEISEAHYGKINRRANLPRAIRHGEVDVVILTGRHHPTDVSVLAQTLPVVSIQWDYPETKVDQVTGFNSMGAAAVVEAMARHGHRRLAWVDAEYPASFFRERQAGFIMGCLQHKIMPDESMFLPIGSVDEAVVARLVERGITGLVAANDDVAYRLAEFCQRQGLRIPEDVSLAGFDGVALPLCNGKVLTSYDPGLAEIGRAAVQVAQQRVREPGISRMIQSREGHLIVGESMGATRNAPITKRHNGWMPAGGSSATEPNAELRRAP